MTLTPRKETTPNTGHHLGGRSGGDSGSQGSDGGHQADQVGDPEGLHPMLPARFDPQFVQGKDRDFAAIERKE